VFGQPAARHRQHLSVTTSAGSFASGEGFGSHPRDVELFRVGSRVKPENSWCASGAEATGSSCAAYDTRFRGNQGTVKLILADYVQGYDGPAGGWAIAYSDVAGGY